METVIHLEPVQITGSHDKTLSLTLSSSFSIVLPPSWEDSTTAAELYAASETGEIWIEKAPSFLVEVLTLVNGEVVKVVDTGLEEVPQIIDLVGESAVWDDIGLALKTMHSPPRASVDGQNPQASYFLHHPKHAADAIPPPGIQVARFQSLRLELEFEFVSSGPTSNMAQISTAGPMLQDHKQHGYNLRPNPKMSQTAWLAQGDIDSELECMPTRQVIVDEAGLLDAGLRRLIGVKGAPAGIRTKRRRSCPSLIEISPGVWNPSYLESFATQTQSIPDVANVLARLTATARSSSLREKLRKLGSSSTLPDHVKTIDEGAAVKEVVTTTLWRLCQTVIDVKPIVKPKTGKQPLPSLLDAEMQDIIEPTDNMEGLDDTEDGVDWRAEFEQDVDYPCVVEGMALDNMIYEPALHGKRGSLSERVEEEFGPYTPMEMEYVLGPDPEVIMEEEQLCHVTPWKWSMG